MKRIAIGAVLLSFCLVSGARAAGAKKAKPKETWQAAQASLYIELSRELKTLWSNGTGQQPQDGTEGESQAVSEPELPQAQVPAQPLEHYCQEHQTAFKRYAREGRMWYSHKATDGEWCREK